MRRFELAEPQTLEEACALLSDDGDAKALAGGTALLTLIKHGIFIPKTLVNLKKIGGMSGIDYDTQRGLRIGALTSIYDVESSPLVRQYYPWLAEACHVVANIRIRNMATIGGNLAHGDYQSDPPTALVALDARVELKGCKGARQMKLSEFLLGSYETALEPGELLSALVVPRQTVGAVPTSSSPPVLPKRGHAPGLPQWYAWNKAYVAIYGWSSGRFHPDRCAYTTPKNLRAARKSLKPFCRRSAPKRAALSSL